jgi:hypothetical protein
MRPRLWSITWLAVSVTVGGCTLAHYAPEIPLRARSGDTAIELKQLDIGWSPAFVFEWRSTGNHAIAQAWLTRPTQAPCTGGVGSEGIMVDGSTTGIPMAGVHEIEVKFPHGLDDLELDAVVDLQTGDGLCVRAIAVSRSVRMEAAKRPYLVFSAGGGRTGDGVSTRALYDAKLGVALWGGPLLLSVTAGIGVARCDRDVCGGMPKQDLSPDPGWAVPVAFDLRYIVGSYAKLHTLWTAPVGLNYSYVYGRLPTPDGVHAVGTHLIQGVVGFGGSPFSIPLGPFRHRERGTLGELVLRCGAAFDADGGGPSFTAGVDYRVMIPL